MTNCISDYRSAPKRTGQRSQQTSPEWRNLAQKQIACRMRQVATYVQEHPVTGIGVALCIGLSLAWFIKRR